MHRRADLIRAERVVCSGASESTSTSRRDRFPVGNIAIAALAVTSLSAGCGSSASTSATSVSSSSPATSVTASTAAPEATAPTFPPSQTAIEPGTYRWDGFGSSISIAVGPGWALGHDNAAFFDLFRGSDFPSISFARFSDVYVDGTTRVAAVDAETVATTLMGRTDLTVTDFSAIKLAGRGGRQFDLVTLKPQTPVFFGTAGDFKLDPEFKTRYRVLDFPGGGVLVIGIPHVNGFDDGIALAEPVVATLIVQPSGAPLAARSHVEVGRVHQPAGDRASVLLTPYVGGDSAARRCWTRPSRCSGSCERKATRPRRPRWAIRWR